MRPTTLVLLTRPRSASDRGRWVLVALTAALAGGLLLAAYRLARLPLSAGQRGDEVRADLAPYVAEAGLRVGVVAGAALLTVPIFALAVQALRIGSLARDRRMAALRLAGATPGEVRKVGAAEAGMAGTLGGVLAGPAYLLLWLLVGVIPPPGARLLPNPAPLDAAAWSAYIVLAGLATALTAAVVQGRVLVDPLGVRRRTARPRPRFGNVWLLTGGPVLVAGSLVVAVRRDGPLLLLPLVSVVALALAACPRLVTAPAGRLAARGGAVDLLAGGRLAADPLPAGRVAGVLGLCGIALSVDTVNAASVLSATASGEGLDTAFYLTGAGLAAAGIAIAAVVAVFTLFVGAADELLDARRPLASLSALGVDSSTLQTVLRRQFSATGVPAVVLGALFGGVGTATLQAATGDPAVVAVRAAVLPALGTALVAALLVSLAARLVARLLRSRLAAATAPENLRVA